MKSKMYIVFTLVIASSASNQVWAGNVQDTNNDADSLMVNVSPVFDFFNSEEVLEITLVFDIKGFLKTKFEPESSYDARLTVITPGKDSLTQNIKVEARGKMRLKYCSFPPMTLKMKNKKNNEAVFPKGNFKLVTHCSQAGNFENYILKEYLAYKLYNIVTPYSFKTRLVVVNYVDVNRPKVSYTEYGFIIENTDNLAARNNAVVVENLKVSQNNMDEYEMARVAFFNYMIGNTDWSVQSQHNVKVLKAADPIVNKGIPVTYDFDYSGFVNTVYATPNDKIPITSVTERYFQGTCFSEELLKQVINEFHDNQDKFLETIDGFQYLSHPQKKIAVAYLNNFFKKYRRQQSLITDINRTCLRML